MEALSKDLWVFIETDEEGKARNVGLELLNPGRRLADAQGGALVAVVIGYKTEAAVKEAAAYGADKIIRRIKNTSITPQTLMQMLCMPW